MLEKVFRLSENQTTARIELLAGVTTFMTMAYITVVQPAVLSGAMFGMKTGLDFGAVMGILVHLKVLHAAYRQIPPLLPGSWVVGGAAH